MHVEEWQGHAFCCDIALSFLVIQMANGNEVKKVQASAMAWAASRPVIPNSHSMMKTSAVNRQFFAVFLRV